MCASTVIFFPKSSTIQGAIIFLFLAPDRISGQKVRQEIVFCGNEANGNLLQSLTVRDIETLQNLVPPKDFRIPAGQVANCLLVFTKPPATVAELGGRVVSAQFEEPHGPLASVQPGEVDSRVGSPQRPPRL